MPSFQVALTNIDPDRLAVHLQRGGDYRSGRLSRWRFEVIDSAGREMPDSRNFRLRRGRTFHLEPLAFGQTWTQDLPMSDYEYPLPPGKYSVRILFHNRAHIAYMNKVDDLMVSSSAAITLTVRPITVQDDPTVATRVMNLMAQIQPEQPLKIVAGTYDEWAYDFVPRDSPRGQLLTIGLPAVLPLIDALEDPELSTQRRALILTLLFSLTGLNTPVVYFWPAGDGQTPDGIVGPFEMRTGPWNVSGGGQGSGWRGSRPSAAIGSSRMFKRNSLDAGRISGNSSRWFRRKPSSYFADAARSARSYSTGRFAGFPSSVHHLGVSV